MVDITAAAVRCFALALLLICAGASVSAQSSSASSATTRSSAAAGSFETATAEAPNVLALEREIGQAIVRGDAAYFERVTAPDFVMTHGDVWTRGGPAALVDDKQSFMKRGAEYGLDRASVQHHGEGG